MPTAHVLLLTHAAMTLALAGIIWAIQLTLVPRLVGATAESWPYHVRRYRGVVFALFWPVVILESGSGVAVALLHPPGIPLWLHGLNLTLILCGWVTVPLTRLVVGHGPVDRFHPEGFRKFARLNWIRVAVWTGRSAVVLAMLWLEAGARAGTR